VSHTIDPRTGRPAEGGPASVTVVAESATKADAWATALMVLGEDRGFPRIALRRIGALVLLREPDGTIGERRNAFFPQSAPGD
jgi:thiamine biosynthesis lipoprotein